MCTIELACINLSLHAALAAIALTTFLAMLSAK